MSTDYREVKALSQSSLKTLDWNVRKFYYDEYLWLIDPLKERTKSKPNEAMIIGDIVDIELTERLTAFDENYVVLGDMPTGQMLKFVESYYKNEKITSNNYTRELAPEEKAVVAMVAYGEAEFKRDKLETVVGRFGTEGIKYYNALLVSDKKTIISPQTIVDANRVVTAMKEDEFVGPLVTAKDSPSKRVYNQLEIFHTEKSVNLKAMLDKVIVDTQTKVIIPIDIKTTGESFISSYITRRYDLQGAFYTFMLGKWRDIHYPGFLMAPFTFAVGFTNGNNPETWEMSRDDLKAGELGGTNRYGKPFKGWRTLVEDYKWHHMNDKWKYPKEVYKNNGIRLLNCYQ